MHLNLLFKEKLKQKDWYVTIPCKTVKANKDNTNQHILHWIAVLSKLFEKCIQTTCLIFLNEHKGPLTYAGFPIMHIENASVFCSLHM